MNDRTSTRSPFSHWYHGRPVVGDRRSLNALKASEILYERNFKVIISSVIKIFTMVILLSIVG